MTENTPAPIATPEEVQAAVSAVRLWLHRSGEGPLDSADLFIVLDALTSSNAEIERVTRERDEETDAKLSYYSQIATLTDQVGRMRERAVAFVEAAERSGAIATEGALARELRAALSPTEPEAMEK